jgi:hypothetical protein
MDHSWNLDKGEWIHHRSWLTNRYWHIYLQALFMRITGDALIGARLFWSFLFAVSTVSIYLAARNLARSHHLLIGAVAALLFFSFRVVFAYAGVTYPDFTLGAHLAMTSVVYLSLRSSEGSKDRILLSVFGLLVFLSLKSRELGLCLLPLFAGVGFDQSGAWSISRFSRRSLWAVAAFSFCAFANLIADSILVTQSPFWDLPERITKGGENPYLFSVITSTPLHVLVEGSFLCPTLLYLASFGVLKNKGYSSYERILWLIPLFAITILFVRTFVTHWDTYDRYLLVTVHFLCVCGSQTFLAFSRLGRKLGFTLFGAAMTVLTSIGAHRLLGWPDGSAYLKNWDRQVFYETLVFPIGSIGCLVLLGLVSKWTRFRVFVFGLFFWLALYPALKTNFVGLVTGSSIQVSQRRFDPLEAFGDRIDLSSGKRLFVLTSLYDDCETFGRDPVSCSRLFNVYFNADTEANQFARGDLVTLDKEFRGFENILLTAQDWRQLSERWTQSQDPEIVLSPDGTRFTLEKDSGNRFYFLKLLNRPWKELDPSP